MYDEHRQQRFVEGAAHRLCRGLPPPSAKIRGGGALSILDARLRRIHPRIVFILGLENPAPALEAEARRLGGLIFRPPHAIPRFLAQCRPGILRHLLGMDYAYVCLPEHPFMMEEQIGAWEIWNHDPGEIACGETR